MALFGKRETVFEVKGDAARWKAGKAALKCAAAAPSWMSGTSAPTARSTAGATTSPSVRRMWSGRKRCWNRFEQMTAGIDVPAVVLLWPYSAEMG